MNYAFALLLPLIVFAGFSKSVEVYPPLNPPERIELPTIEVQTLPQASSEVIAPIVEETKEVPIECSCVRYAKSLIPSIPNLNAIDYPINTVTPKAGDIIKLQYYNATTSRYIYHLSVIEEITEEGYKIKEANFEKCKVGERIIQKNDEHILGFFNPTRQKLIDELTPIQKETLWNESGWSHYDTRGSVLRGSSGEWGVAQFMPATWKWLTEKRRQEDEQPILLDKTNFEDQITMFKYGWDKGVVWYGRSNE